MSTKVLNSSGYFTVRLSAQVPPEDQPTTPQFARIVADPEVLDHVGHDVLGEVVGRVAAHPVDAFGVVVEGPAGIGEDEYRRVAAVARREIVDGAHGIGGADPVRGGVELDRRSS